jgi:hypothetical protein
MFDNKKYLTLWTATCDDAYNSEGLVLLVVSVQELWAMWGYAG